MTLGFAPGGVDHGGLGRQSRGEIVHRGNDDQLGSGEPDAAVPGVRPPMMMTSPFMPVVSGNW